MTELPIIQSASNELLMLENGRQLIDFVAGYGSVIVGHCNSNISEKMKQQMDTGWTFGQAQHPGYFFAQEAVAEAVQPYRVRAFYSTGMEAIEFTLRVAAIHKQKNGFAAIEKNMHGKSLATSSLSWENSFRAVHFYSIKATESEADMLTEIEILFQSRSIAAFYLELIQGSANGRRWSRQFYSEVLELCRRYDVVSIVDEILTGFYRAGTISKALEMNLSPDILVFGKAMANGFPVSAVLMLPHLMIDGRMLPRSTFSENPLACCAVAATWTEMQNHDMPKKVAQIAEQIGDALVDVHLHGVEFIGDGLLWFLNAKSPQHAQKIWAKTLNNGSLTSCTGNTIRLMPTATIRSVYLETGLNHLCDAVKECQ